MKRLLPTLAASLLAFSVSSLPAESPEDGGKPKKTAPGPDGGMREKMKARFVENLSPEIRERFRAAREKALKDPKIQELQKNAERANDEFFKAMRDKMMEIDPELAEIVKKHGNDAKDGKKERWGRPHGPGPMPGLGSLSDSEREKLMAARETAKSDPAVQAAEKKKDAAKTPAERQAASEEYRKAMKDAILKADPSLAPVLEKLGPRPPVPSKGPEGMGVPMEKESD